jgi:MFS family permease
MVGPSDQRRPETGRAPEHVPLPPPGAPAWVPPHAAAAVTTQKESERAEYVWALALLFPVIAFFLFAFAWMFLNSPHPAVFPAGSFLVLLLLVSAGAVALVVWTHPPARRRSLWQVFVPAAVVAIPLGLALLAVVEDMYGTFGVIAFFYFMSIVLAVAVPLHGGMLIAAFIVRKKASLWTGDRMALGSGLATGGVFSVTGVLMLFSLDRQAQLAREAHEVPGLPVLVLLLVLILGVVLARRRTRD